jgi:hypothetical protein
MPEYLEVLFHHRRMVLINGVNMGETNTLLELEGGIYEVKLAPPHDFAPARQEIDLRNTSALNPKQVEFNKI